MAAFLVCVLVLIILIVPIIFFVQGLITQSYSLYLLVKQDQALKVWEGCTYSLCDTLFGFFESPAFANQIEEFSKAVTNWIVRKGSTILASVPSILVNVFVVFFSMFYFLRDGKSLLDKVGGFLSFSRTEYAHLLQKLREILRGMVYGSFVVAFIQGIVGGIGFFFFGIPSPLFWGLGMALFSLIPYVGTALIWVPAALILLVGGVIHNSTPLLLKGVGLFFYGFIFISGVDNLLRAKFMGGKAKTHPILILLGILGGVPLFGPLGMFIGPVVLAITVVLASLFFKQKVVE